MAASMGQFLLSSGAQGKRYATPHARVMMHQPSGGIGGTATDVRINAQLILHMKKVLAALTAVYDTMQYIKPQIQTVCLGQAASAAAVLLAAGAPGKRLALPNVRVLIHLSLIH